jgi:hypothetical protein
MALKDVLTRVYGVKTDMDVNPLLAATGLGVVVQLLQPNPNRLAWTLINLGAVPVYLAFTPNPGVANGIYTAALGGNTGLIYSEDFELVTYPLWAFSAAVCDVYLVEVFEI